MLISRVAGHVPAVRPLPKPYVREQNLDLASMAVDQCHCFGCIGRFKHHKASILEHVDQGEEDQRLVFDN